LSSITTTAAKCKSVKFEDDDEEEYIAAASHKKARKTSDDDLLSRSDAAELIGQVMIELQAMQNSFNWVQELLADFAGHANGKQHVVIQSPFKSHVCLCSLAGFFFLFLFFFCKKEFSLHCWAPSPLSYPALNKIIAKIWHPHN
jgi:hypothetical protein